MPIINSGGSMFSPITVILVLPTKRNWQTLSLGCHIHNGT